jgi:putative phage-type endonuclease
MRYITASKVAAILGLSPWESPLSLWHKMRGDVPREPQTKTQARGHYLEPSVLAWWIDQHPGWVWDESRGRTCYSERLPWAAAAPDGIAVTDTGELIPVEAKTAADDTQWGKPGTDEIPVYYAAQCMWTLHVMQAPRIYVPVLTGRLEFREYVVDYDQQVAAGIEAAARDFYLSLDEGGVAPPLDAHPATYESLRRVHPDIHDDDIELDRDVAAAFCAATRAAKTADTELTAAKIAVAAAMGTARTAHVGGQTVAIRKQSAAGVPFVQAARTLPALTPLEAGK